MSRILVVARGNPGPWAELLREALPDHEVIEGVPDGDARPIRYAVVGRPPPGLVRDIPGLEVLFSLNAGIEHLLADDTIPAGLPIVRMVDDGLIEGMVDWVLAHTLAWHRNLFVYRRLQAERRWEPLDEKPARDRTVTVLGAGALGRPVAEMLLRFGFRVRVWSRTLKEIPGATAFAGADALGPAVDGADIVVNLLPVTPATTSLLGRNAFDRMARGGFFINGGRGAHVVDAELIAALDRGQLDGAALDVFREEPLPAGHPFWRHPKILVSPHVAAPTQPSTAVAAIVANLRRHEAALPLGNVVDRSRGY